MRRFEVNGQVEPAPRGGRRASKMDQDMVDYLIGKVSKKPGYHIEDTERADACGFS